MVMGNVVTGVRPGSVVINVLGTVVIGKVVALGKVVGAVV